MSKVWDERNYVIEKQACSGSGPLHGTLDNAAAVDQGSGIVRIPMTAHGFNVGNYVQIAGSTNYDRVHKIIAKAANTFDIYATYVAETFAGTETVKTALGPGVDFQMIEARLHLSAVGGAAENYTITLDSENGSAFDVELESAAMAADADVPTLWNDKKRFFNAGDVLLFEYANTNARTWGLEIVYRLFS
jgi:hypothetical protein